MAIKNASLQELNRGQYLNLFGTQYTMKIGFIVNQNPNDVKIFKHISMLLNTKYAIKNIKIIDSNDLQRTVLGTHITYKIREGIHSVPLKNPLDFVDLRGTWSYIEIEIESINNKKVDLFSVTTYLRKSII